MQTSASRWITSVLMAAAVSLTFVSSEALAKRMGSGGDSGMQRSMPAPSTPASKPATPGSQQPASAAAPATGAASTAAAASKSSWMGPLAAFAAGGLLAALFMGGGFEGIGAADILFLLLIVAAAYFFLRRRAQNASASAATTGGYQRQGMPQPAAAAAPSSGLRAVELGSRVGGSASVSGMTAAHLGQHTHPDWFDESAFLRGAEDWFVRLQAAWDANDRVTLSALTTPELFAELSAQLDGSGQHQTRVDEIHAQLLELTREQGQWLVSVRFTGYIAEEAGAFPHAVREVWHLLRDGDAEGSWKLAGIQQDRG